MTGARRRAAAIAVAVVALAATVVGARFRLTSALSELMPEVEDRALAALAARLADSELTRTQIFVVRGVDDAASRTAARELSAALRRDEAIAWAQDGPGADAAAAIHALYAPHRFALCSETPERSLPSRLDDDGLRAEARALLHQFRLPSAPLVRRLAPADPWLCMLDLYARLEAARPHGVAVVDGQFVTTEPKPRAVVFAATKAPAMDTSAMQPLESRLQSTFASLAPAEVSWSGVMRHALASRAAMERDLRLVSIVSTAAVTALFALFFRSLALLALSLAPIAIGILAALATTLLAFGRIHGVTLAFGATLIGVCIDFPVHLALHHLLRRGREPGSSSAVSPAHSALWRGLSLGAATTVIGYAGLMLSGLPAIREIAVFASVGVATALGVTRYVVEPWLPANVAPSGPMRALVALLSRTLATLTRRPRLAAVAPVLALVVCAVGTPGLSFVDDPKALLAQEATLALADADVRAAVGGHESGRVVLARASHLDAALEINDRLAATLARAVEEGLVESARGIQPLLFSPSLQRRNLEVLRAQPNLVSRTLRALEREGFVTDGFGPFARDLPAALAAEATLLTLDGVLRSPLAPMVRPFILGGGSEVAVATYLRGVQDVDGLRARVAEVPGAALFDQRAFVAATLETHRRSASELIGLGLLLVSAAVWLRYRDARRSLAVLLPALIGGPTTLALLAAIGETMTLLHLVALVLVLGMSVDYGVFLAEAATDGDLPPRAPETAGALGTALAGVTMAATSTALSLGLLGLSTNPALRAIGLTAAGGVCVSVVLSTCLHALLFVRRSPSVDGIEADHV